VLILLPPSETKRPGGSGVPLLIDDLAFAGLAPQREAAVGALEELAKDPGEMARVLKLSARQIGEVDVNAGVRSSPTMPAIDRFTGVLFDALDASSLGGGPRAWLGENVAIQTALLGPVGSLDPIPAFRLSAGQRLPGLAPLKRHWAEATTAELGVRGPVLDMRSEAYRALGPVPEDVEQAYVRVVNGEGRALNHLNKQTKGVFARALALAEASFGSLEELVEWARTVGFVVSAERGEIVLEEASSVPEAKIFAIGPVGR
jgi:cytoplasmic iron level regulating protein YaaA (DUF328/UPF0246 family)